MNESRLPPAPILLTSKGERFATMATAISTGELQCIQTTRCSVKNPPLKASLVTLYHAHSKRRASPTANQT
ncbi:hypothetical protein NDU88_003882 [Pleurodeles waltl]|uniref:Uncharacterized protein n=1 Tax=Pleurodeles waltl TaxID=8319 RepID=A0AAV7QN55_PLEWA|nr:hypothetical protein NDU88_006860 [Pleurodeles waltl]KAJ1208497.1 hypothetical protein NDU88_003882 [Pleurodeles waltl]